MAPVLLWGAIHRSPLIWLGQAFTMAKATNLALLLAVAAVIAYGLAARRTAGMDGGPG
ncbi:MAG: hypothetical protein GY824_26825, partial [Delftia sp.]|nr:hypothetical protein [Delftia sp.]